MILTLTKILYYGFLCNIKTINFNLKEKNSFYKLMSNNNKKVFLTLEFILKFR